MKSNLITSPPVGKGAKYCNQRVCLSVCPSVCSLAYLKNQLSKVHEIVCTC